MSAIYFAIPTNAGQAKISNALALGVPLKITHMAVGDGNGQPVTPDPAQTKLVREQRRAPLNALFQDPLNPAQLVAQQIIPENEGGWWIHEVGLFDESGTLIAIANAPPTYKPQMSEGSGRTQGINVVLIVSDTSAVELKIDPSVVLATRKYVDDVMASHKLSRDHPDASEMAKGFSRFATQAEVDDAAADDVAVTPKKLNKYYKRKNILGPVSQVAGIPTGAIIERGSNANGEYIKFADGTLVCIASVSITYFQSTMLQKNWVLPHPHVAGILAIFTGPQLTDVSSRLNRATAPAAAFNGPMTTTPLRLFATGSDVFQSGDSANACAALAIGRWY
ncbi:phage tail protein [Aeromonas veronii]|uniref:phage tail protein n=1 Tax=Aeromonas veronii TaxID=654 RepID=UPI003A4E35F8